MNKTFTIQEKLGTELTENELQQINASIFREFKVTPLSQKDLKERHFFLLKNGNEVLAMGALWKVYPVIFNDETFDLYAFLNVVSNSKGKGFGKQLVVAMKENLVKDDKTAFGFTMPKNIGFYQSCGFSIDKTSTKRFVFDKDGERITNQDGQYIFYSDSSDHFMEKVLHAPSKEISIPTDGLW